MIRNAKDTKTTGIQVGIFPIANIKDDPPINVTISHVSGMSTVLLCPDLETF